MSDRVRWLGLVLAASMFWSASAMTATYYVDFADGDNTADGRSPRTAWKHSPGDVQATGNPADVELAPGDTIVFKGGVQYHGSIKLTVFGAEGKPITLDGNAAGFGEGKAILDGGRVITGWKRVDSVDQVGGNSQWRKIFYADIDATYPVLATVAEVGERVTRLRRRVEREIAGVPDDADA